MPPPDTTQSQDTGVNPVSDNHNAPNAGDRLASRAPRRRAPGANQAAMEKPKTMTTSGRKTGASRPPAPENHGLNPGLLASADTSALGGFLPGNIRINPTDHDSEKTRRPE